MSAPENERRNSTRLKIKVPVELYVEASSSPIRGTTSDLSVSGCYVQTIFPFPAGTNLELKLQLENTLLIVASVVASDPQVGNGIRFMRMLPEDIEELRAYLATADKSESSPTLLSCRTRISS